MPEELMNSERDGGRPKDCAAVRIAASTSVWSGIPVLMTLLSAIALLLNGRPGARAILARERSIPLPTVHSRRGRAPQSLYCRRPVRKQWLNEGAIRDANDCPLGAQTPAWRNDSTSERYHKNV